MQRVRSRRYEWFPGFGRIVRYYQRGDSNAPDLWGCICLQWQHEDGSLSKAVRCSNVLPQDENWDSYC